LQSGAEGPPQSTPVSVPFFTPSPAVAFAHLPDVQTPDLQSKPFVHGPPSFLPFGLPVMAEPPDDVSGSAPQAIHTAPTRQM
jgi:hypothetical protein